MRENLPTREAFISRLPKVELHLHLEGSLRPETLWELSGKRSDLREKVAAWISERKRLSCRYGSMAEFLKSFALLSTLLETPADYALVTTRMMEWLASQSVKYAEVTLSAGVILWKKQSIEAIFEAISSAAEQAQARLGLRVNWIFDAVRQFGTDHAREVLQRAARYRSSGVVAFGIGGDELQGPARLFESIYREARDRGLHLTAHAGETDGPDSIRDAVERLGAERIGHALSAVRDAELLQLLHDRRIPVEVCLTSNVATGLLHRVEDHPLPQFLETGLIVTLNSDDPGIFGTSLEHEFALAATVFSLSDDQLVQMCDNAMRASFLPDEARASLLKALYIGSGVGG